MYEGGHQTIGCVDWEQPVLKEKSAPTVEAWRADCGSNLNTIKFSGRGSLDLKCRESSTALVLKFSNSSRDIS